MKNTNIASILMILGTLLVIVSIMISNFGSSSLTGQWPEEKAEVRAQAGATLHRLAHDKMVADNPEAHKLEKGKHAPAEDLAKNAKEYDEAKKVFGQTTEELEHAQNLPDWIAFGLRWLGCGVLVIGLAFYFRDRRHAN